MANENIENAGIITVDGTLNTVVIAGDTYTGTAYAQGAISQAIEERKTVAAQGCTIASDILAEGKTLAVKNSGLGRVSLTDSNLILEGTVKISGELSSNRAVTVAPETKLVLDLGAGAVRIAGYDTMFDSSQIKTNLSITADFGAALQYGEYTLATDAATFDGTLTVTSQFEPVSELQLNETKYTDNFGYRLWRNADHDLVLTVSPPISATAIVTPEGSANSVTIEGVTYTGIAKKTENIADVIDSTFSLIVMQGGRVQNREDSPVSLGNDQELLADTVRFYSNQSKADGGAINNSGKLTVTSFSGLAYDMHVRASFSDNRADGNGGAVNNNGVFSAADVLFDGNRANLNGGAVNNNGVFSATDVHFDGNRANLNGGALYNSSGTATITGATFTGNSAASGGAVYNLNADLTLSDSIFSGNTSSGFGGALLSYNTSQSLTLENCSFLTRTDTVFASGGTITLGGVIVTAAQLNFGSAITIKPDTKILLDLSSYSGTELTSGLLANYDARFAPQQENLTISVNAASLTQKQGNYVIASQVGDLGFKESISVYATGSDESLFSVALGGTTLYNGRSYSLANSNGNIVFSIDGNIDTLFVNSEWAGLADGTPVAIPGGTAHIGVDALDKLASAKTLNPKKIKFAGGSYGTVIFGGSESENVEDVEANTNLTFLNGTFSKSVFAGNKIKTEEMLQTLSLESSLDIQDGSYAAYVMGGDYLSTEQPNVALVNTTGSRSMNISGGEFNGLVAGGSFIKGGTATLVSQFEGDIHVTISGGTFQRRIYGGDITDKMANSTADFIDGTITVTLDASANDISINESIVCGSYGYGTVKGNVVFTVKGLGTNLRFSDASVVNGGSGNGYLRTSGKMVKEYDNFVNGTSTAVFDGFSGNFDARLTLFDAISFSHGAKVSLTNRKDNLAELSAWSFADGASVAFCDGQINDFTGDTLNIDLTSWDKADDWTLATGSSDAAFLGFEAFKAVKFGGTAAEYVDDVWKAEGFALSLSEDKKSMVLAQIN